MKPCPSLSAWLLLLVPLAAQEPTPPVAPTKPHSFDFHGKKIDDPYAWIKDKKNPETIKYIEAENAYREAVTKHLRPFEEKLYKEMLSHIKQTDLDVPVRDHGFWYYTKTEEGKQYPIYCRKKGSLDAAEEVLLDVNRLAGGQKFLSANPAGVSDDGKLYAFRTDTTGFREYYLSVKDLASGKLVEDRLVKVVDFEWAPDNKTCFYITEDAAKRPYRLYRHLIGEPKEQDVLVYEEKDELYRLHVHRTRDRKFLVHQSSSSTTTECRVLAADQPTGEFQVVGPRKEGVEYSLDHRDGLFYLRTNAQGRTNFSIQTVPVADLTRGTWTDFLPYNPAVLTQGITLFADFAVVPPAAVTAGRPISLRDLIGHVVRSEVEAFKQRQADRRLLKALTARQIKEGLAAGKVQSGGSDLDQHVDPEQAVATAIEAFADGLYLVVVDENEVKDLDGRVPVTAESRLTFIRLTMLAGG